jgi:hypothetical protein
MMSFKHSTISDVAEAISGLSYTDLRSIAAAMAEMCAEPDVRKPPKTQHEFADLLADWADALGS